ncbi:MAG: TIGR02678 family protein [Bifidobacteriaceae bacterium]|nr:TIGR02678 family protein [Bifidobacteriaceae bacterium]
MSPVQVVGGAFLASAVEESAREELQRAARVLLANPLVAEAIDPDGFRLVRQHLVELRQWFDANTGWRLIDDTAVIRLNKQIVPDTATGRAIAGCHPARPSPAKPPFSARRYVLFCLAAAVLERSDAQTTLGDIANGVMALARERDLGGIVFTFETRDERSDLAQAVELLLRLGAIRRVSGDEQAFVRVGGDAALYDVERRVLARLLVATQSPARVGARLAPAPPDIGQLERELHPAREAYTDQERNRAIRWRLTAQLLEDPVCCVEELDAEAAAYLTRQRQPLTDRIAQLTGLVAEIRAEGIAMADPEDSLSDLRVPEVGTGGHAALLLAEHLAQAGPSALAHLEERMRRWIREYGSHWRASAREPGAAAVLVRDALAKLEALGLVRLAGREARPLPAIRRFRFDRARVSPSAAAPGPEQAGAALFDLSASEDAR